MKSPSTSTLAKVYAMVTIFLSAAGLAYALVNHFILDKPNTDLVVIFACLFVACIASWQRNKLTK